MEEKARLEWSEPPPDKRGGPQAAWQEVWRELRQRPGEWAKLPGAYTAAVQNQIKRGQYAGTVAGEFECTARRAEAHGTRRYYLWVRYVGVPDQEDSPAGVQVPGVSNAGNVPTWDDVVGS